jgi:predicted permease
MESDDDPKLPLGDDMSALFQDFRYALRTLAARPMLTVVIVLSLGIGIGANSAIFSVVNALLLNPLPYPQPQRLVNIWIQSPGIGILRDWPSPGQFDDLRKETRSFEEISISRLRSLTLTGRNEPQLIDGMFTSSGIFHLLGAKAMMGRLLLPDDEKTGAHVVVLSNPLWRRLFSSDPQIVGKIIVLNGTDYTVAGVLQDSFRVDSEVMPAEGRADKMDFFVPLTMNAEFLGRRGDENYNLVARLKSGVSITQAQADVDMVARRIREKDKRDRTFGFHVVGFLEQVVGDVQRTLLVLLGSVALVLLIACANVANLLLTRAAGRQREMALRGALGAGMGRIARQLLTESVLLALLGGLAGIAIAEGSLLVVRAMNPGNIPRFGEIGISVPVIAFTLGVSLATGILFGLAPVWSAIKLDLSAALKAGGRSGGEGGGLRFSAHRLRGLLVISELAFSVMLLIGAGLLARSFFRLEAVPPGFSTDHVISMSVVVSGPKYRDDAVRLRFFEDIAQRIKHLAGVESYGVASPLPLVGEVSWGGINVEGFTPQPGQELQVDQRVADTDYFSTLSIPLVQGRYFNDRDTAASPQVAIIDQKFAQRFWPRGDAVGKRLWFDPKKPILIAGVVGNVRQYGIGNDSKVVVYFPHMQRLSGGVYLVARSASDPGAMSNPIVAQIHAVDPNVVVYDIRTMPDRLYASLARQRFASTLLGSFAIFAMLLAAVGVYGVMSYLVTQNRQEIGIRVALGAQPGSIVGLVLRHGLALAACGIVAGLIGSAALTRVMESLLFGVNALDWLTFGSVALALAAVAFAATVVPAMRATAVDPTVALRGD